MTFNLTELVNKIQSIKLSNDAKEILKISLLTNSYFPKQNISNEQFLALKLDWLIKNGDFKLMEDYLFKNKNINQNLKLVKFLVNEYLPESKLKKSCNIFFNIKEVINDDYLSKFKIGKSTPKTRIPIYADEKLKKINVKIVAIILSWNISNILKKKLKKLNKDLEFINL